MALRTMLYFLAVPIVITCVRAGHLAGQDETRPSQAFYFDWISSQYEGSTEAQSLTQLEFFEWLHDEYGMVLDIYSLDVGNIDDGPFTAGVGRVIPNHWGLLDSETFQTQFPRGFTPLVEKAKSFGARLGIWLGPDGFGETPEEERARIDTLVRICRDYNFVLFKLDKVAGGLRKEKQDALIEAIQACREHDPDFIVTNHRVDMGKAEPYVTASLWEGVETYLDVFSWNTTTAPHHRAGALARELPPGLTRRLEDHGVCLSSCLDYWEDDLVLQAFNRALILAPEIYGNPWLLRDDEFPKLARLFNLHRKYRDILVNGTSLPEEEYGPFAVARGDGQTRFLTLRNLTWEPVEYRVKLDESIGLTEKREVELRRFHPSERILGRFRTGSVVAVDILPFRSALLMATTAPSREVGVEGCDYEIVRDTPGKPVRIKLLGFPGSRADVRLVASDREFTAAKLDGQDSTELLHGSKVAVQFGGTPLEHPWHRKVATLQPSPVPEDAEALYEASCFAGDSNALEVRSLQRSGPTRIPQVEKARDTFFTQPMFVNRGIWDLNLFDGDVETFFIARLPDRTLRIDFGEPIYIDKLVLKMRSKYEHDINPELHQFSEDAIAEVSRDLATWTPIGTWSGKGTIAIAKIPAETPIRYVRVHGAPRRLAEIEGYKDGARLERSEWRASNLFFSYAQRPAEAAWTASLTLDEIPKSSYLAIALHGEHGDEGAYAALRVDGRPVGAPDRAVSYGSNTWEFFNVERDSNYTYYVPLDTAMAGKNLDVVVLILKGGKNEIQPEVYLTAYPPPFESKELVLKGS